jgi:hypothetical protein
VTSPHVFNLVLTHIFLLLLCHFFIPNCNYCKHSTPSKHYVQNQLLAYTIANNHLIHSPCLCIHYRFLLFLFILFVFLNTDLVVYHFYFFFLISFWNTRNACMIFTWKCPGKIITNVEKRLKWLGALSIFYNFGLRTLHFLPRHRDHRFTCYTLGKDDTEFILSGRKVVRASITEGNNLSSNDITWSERIVNLDLVSFRCPNVLDP